MCLLTHKPKNKSAFHGFFFLAKNSLLNEEKWGGGGT